ncbi:hypothetical protein [Actinoplanes sp. NPDC020271]|uniref:hypothetical protein n=1 Tax=Actinoplanes sp. NPDC020271 TaxID=3363896 RepID=UPI0037B8085E
MSVLDSLDGARVHDIIVPGYLDTGRGHPQFAQLGGAVYLELELDRRFLLIDGSPAQGSLTLEIVDRIAATRWLDDEDEEFATAYIGGLFFDRGSAPRITRIRYAVNGESELDRGVLRCAEFRLGSTTHLFFDPMTFERLQLGVSGGYEDWQRESRDRERTIFGYTEEHVWEPATPPGERLSPR